MKKIFILILVCLLCCLTACRKTSNDDYTVLSDISGLKSSIDELTSQSVYDEPTSEEIESDESLTQSLESTIPIHKHNYKSRIAQNETCVTDGVKVYYCDCGNTYTENITAQGHVWEDWIVISEPTIYAEGNSSRKCNVCNYVESILIPKLSTEATGTITVTDAQIKVIKDKFLQLVNSERTKLGLLSLNSDEHLDYAAKIRSKEIIESFSHTRPNGESCFTVIDQSVYPISAAGENIVMTTHLGDGSTNYIGQWTGSVKDLEAVAAWMFKLFKESDGHYKNMISAEYKDCGYGISYVIDEVTEIPVFYGVHLFGAK